MLDHALEIYFVGLGDGLDCFFGDQQVFVQHFEFVGGLHQILLEDL